MAEDTFEVDELSGAVKTNKLIDRERRSFYIVPVYVVDTGKLSATQFDVAVVHVEVTDLNDHSPVFRPGACYPLAIPENNDQAVVHTVVATDEDAGVNGRISYTITAGNFGNKFSVDKYTGEVSARPLDRESHSRYVLTITAVDGGSPPRKGSCNISVLVEDQNDNDPRFNSSTYVAAISEDVPVDTSVLTVRARDPDLGVNSRIIYSLANESQWLFRVDNKTGVITTAG